MTALPATPIPAANTPARLTRMLLACGLAPLLYVATIVAQDIGRTDYDPVHHWGSELSLGPLGWVQITNFVATGALLVAFAIGLRRALRGERGGTALPILVGLFGIELVIAGAFVMDPDGGYPTDAHFSGEPSLHATIHNINALPTFLTMGALAAVGVWWYARQAESRGWSRGWVWYSLAVAVITPLAMVGAGILEDVPGSHFGLMQRVAMFVGWPWIAVLAGNLLRRSPALQRV